MTVFTPKFLLGKVEYIVVNEYGRGSSHFATNNALTIMSMCISAN
jgi:hypothetical protein